MKTRTLLTSILIAIILTLALLGKAWSLDGNRVNAQTIPTIPTIPTEPPDEKPTPTEEPAKPSCIFGKIEQPSKLDLFVPLKKATKQNWGGVMNPEGSACGEAVEMVCVIPVHLLPLRSQLRYHREALLTRQYIKGKIDNTPSCENKIVYFNLTRAERVQYVKDKSRIGIFWYNLEMKNWEECGDISLDPKLGPYGQLSCQTTQWGYFALGWPAKK